MANPPLGVGPAGAPGAANADDVRALQRERPLRGGAAGVVDVLRRAGLRHRRRHRPRALRCGGGPEGVQRGSRG
eukprot:6843825-Pyramimonas_sp.AAC.1